MNSQTKNSNRLIDTSTTTRCIWVMLEPAEVIELKRIAMDRDTDGAVAFFSDLLTPRVRVAAMKRGIALEMLVEDKNDGRISG